MRIKTLVGPPERLGPYQVVRGERWGVSDGDGAAVVPWAPISASQVRPSSSALGLQALARLVLGPNDVAELGATMPIFSAQIGVCWVLWMILWAICFGNMPASASATRNVVSRIVTTFVLGIATFVLYYFFAASSVLHEPPITARLSGNALGWIDWWVLWTLVYVLCFESFGVAKLRPQEN
ncbi:MULTISPECIES: hypothetical protein [Nocardiaceae]|uniref:Uncharacterized protein n=1 Tax=Rhodococcoides kroppenstedtii TaxID=293050 RepID=A0ABS7NRM6_9NOCA|nr:MULTISPECIES: hypothetical protein [Rhodococcus]MBY6312304.1 hypothetical protein [Rhodococcus kroppenstedtii]MBY6319612.1 hypothetical protein [Rhodococcus kroppenstedtii]MBY6398295.1 hypothetical protein [Rhodococcus kroppenstedtii]